MSRSIRVAIAGVGNCASSLVQGVEYYRDAEPGETIPGLMHVVLGGYHARDVEFAPLSTWTPRKSASTSGRPSSPGPNNTIRFADVPKLGVLVQRAATLDGLGKYYRGTVEESPAEPVDVAEAQLNFGGNMDFKNMLQYRAGEACEMVQEFTRGE